MITNLEKKLNGLESITREELFILVDSWGRKDSFNTFDDIIIEQCTKKEKYDLSNLDVSQIDCLSEVFKESLYDGDKRFNNNNSLLLLNF